MASIDKTRLKRPNVGLHATARPLPSFLGIGRLSHDSRFHRASLVDPTSAEASLVSGAREHIIIVEMGTFH